MNFYLEHFQYGLLCFSSLFTLINPFGILPIYLTMTQNITKQQRKDINQKGLIAAGSILIIFAFLGEFIFSIYGIKIEAICSISSSSISPSI